MKLNLFKGLSTMMVVAVLALTLVFSASAATVPASTLETNGQIIMGTYTWNVASAGPINMDKFMQAARSAQFGENVYYSYSVDDGWVDRITGAAMPAFTDAEITKQITQPSDWEGWVAPVAQPQLGALPSEIADDATTGEVTVVLAGNYKWADSLTASNFEATNATVSGVTTVANAPNALKLDLTFTANSTPITIQGKAGSVAGSTEETTVVSVAKTNAGDPSAVNDALALVNAWNPAPVGMSVLNTAAAAKGHIEGLIDSVKQDATVNAVVTTVGFSPATHGHYDDEPGTNGFYTFKVTLSRGNTTEESNTLTLVINGYAGTVNRGDEQDQIDVNTVKALIESSAASWSPASQENDLAGYTVNHAKAYVEGKVNALSLNGVTATVVNGAFTASTDGDAGTPNGTAGSYAFTVSLQKNSATNTTATKTIVITAKAYVPVGDTYTVTLSRTNRRGQDMTSAQNYQVIVMKNGSVWEHPFVVATYDAGGEMAGYNKAQLDNGIAAGAYELVTSQAEFQGLSTFTLHTDETGVDNWDNYTTTKALPNCIFSGNIVLP